MTGSDHANSSVMKMLTLMCLCSCSLAGVFGVEVKMEVTEGESVTLNTDPTELQRDDLMWKFGPHDILIAKINRQNNKSRFYDENADGRFRDRLKINNQTGSLTIINSRTTDSGLYTVSSTKKEMINTINLTVYAHLPVPVINRDSSLNSSLNSSSSSSSCSLVCSAVNVSHVTLSWFKGNSVLSNTSVSNLSSRSDLLLHLECVDDSYSCVLNNPIRNQTQHLNNTQLCHTCAAVLPVSWTVLISAAAAAAAGSLLIVIALGIFCICRKHRRTHPKEAVQTDVQTDIIYARPTFYKGKAHKPRAEEQENVLYAEVSKR